MFLHTALTAVLLVIPQADEPWHVSGKHPAHPHAAVVTGRVELSPTAADAAALDKALDETRHQLERRAEDHLRRRTPFWMPESAGERMIDRWSANLSTSAIVEVVDRTRVDRDHGSFRSYQTYLLVEQNTAAIDDLLEQLDRQIAVGSRQLLCVSGGTVGWWALLAFLWMWFDRITRGYMPWRLGFLFVAMGVAVPGVALTAL